MTSSILITGGSGFFGRHFAKRCLELPREFHRIALLSRGEHRQHQTMEWLKDDDRLRSFIGDVRDLGRLNRAFRGVDVVVHAAALKRIEVGIYNPEEMVLTNVLGTMNVVQACRDQKVSKVVLVSSDKAYRPTSSTYGLSKAMAEQIFLAANQTSGGSPIFSVCRYGNVAGSTGSVIPRWLLTRKLGGTPTCTDEDCTRYWMRIELAVSFVLETIQEMKSGELNIPFLYGFRLGDLAKAMDIHHLKLTGLPEWEKKHEQLGAGRSSETAPRLDVDQLKRELQYVYPHLGS